MMDLSEKLTPQCLKILECVGADDKITGSPFADPSGNGMKKYMEIIFKSN